MTRVRQVTRASLALAAIVLAAPIAPATAAARQSPIDPRIRYVVFNNDAVTTVSVSSGISTMIQFQNDEVIETISAGDTKAW